MKVTKIINNNIVCSLDDTGNEIIIMGRGLGFGKKAGQEVDESKVEKIFRMESSAHLEQLKKLLENLPLEYVQVSNEIISFAKKNLNMELSQNIYLTLTDHIGFAIDRHKEGMYFANALLAEVKRFYPEEFSVGLHGLELVKEKTGIVLPEDEAASIALHLLTAEFNIQVRDSFTITEMINEIMHIINQHIKGLEEDTLHRDRLISELRFLAYRLLLMPPEPVQKDNVFYESVCKYCEKEYSLAKIIEKVICEKYSCQMTEEEKIYLTLNIKRINDVKHIC